MKQLLIDLLFVALGVMICAPALPVFTSGVALAKITNSAQATVLRRLLLSPRPPDGLS